MPRLIILAALLAPAITIAGPCPGIEGRFRCVPANRAAEALDITIVKASTGRHEIYSFFPSGQIFVNDGSHTERERNGVRQVTRGRCAQKKILSVETQLSRAAKGQFPPHAGSEQKTIWTQLDKDGNSFGYVSTTQRLDPATGFPLESMPFVVEASCSRLPD